MNSFKKVKSTISSDIKKNGEISLKKNSHSDSSQVVGNAPSIVEQVGNSDKKEESVSISSPRPEQSEKK